MVAAAIEQRERKAKEQKVQQDLQNQPSAYTVKEAGSSISPSIVNIAKRMERSSLALANSKASPKHGAHFMVMR